MGRPAGNTQDNARFGRESEKIPSLQELILYEEAQHEATHGKIET